MPEKKHKDTRVAPQDNGAPPLGRRNVNPKPANIKRPTKPSTQAPKTKSHKGQG
jgi:hypothetical protein